MNFIELKKLSLQELQKKLQDLCGQLFVLRFQIDSGKNNKFAEVSKLKKQIARVQTLLSQHRRQQPTIIQNKESSLLQKASKK